MSQPQRERQVLLHLERQEFEYYAPLERVRTRALRAGRSATRPLFARYVFVVITSGWHRLLVTWGVSTVLMNDGVPSRVPTPFIKALRAQEKDGVIILDRPPRYKVGDQVTIQSTGVFDGLNGLYLGQSSRMREQVLLTMLGRVELGIGDTLIAASS
jgi:transcriptional antiterminator RfaH